MKCPKCNNEFKVQFGAKIITKNCKILTAMTTIVTVQCEKCKYIFQVPLTSSSFMSVKKND